jgi:enoyl-CoA hydratase
MSHEVLTDVEGHTLVITLNRPEARNAIDGATAHHVAAAMERLDREPELRAGVLTGAGGVFCAGMDLKTFVRGESSVVPGRGFAGLTERRPRKPLIAAVEGWALAGGFELLLACDLAVGARDARLGVPEVKRGLVAAAGGVVVLPRRVPTAIALEMILTGDPIDAARAYELGLLNQVTEPGEALAVALELSARIAANGPLAVEISKQVAYESADWDAGELWTRQAELVDPVFASRDAHEGAVAFAEKRPPRWTGA